MARINFDARSVQPNIGFDPIPAGWYHAAIDQSELKPTGDGGGMYLELRFNVLDGRHAGRKVTWRLNTQNANPKTVEIAYGQLSALCHAANVLVLEDTQQLHGVPVKIKVSVRPGGPKKDAAGNPTGEHYDPSNDIKGVININDPSGVVTDTGAAAAAPAMGATMAPQAPQAPAWAPPAGGPAWTPPAAAMPPQAPPAAPAWAPPPMAAAQPQAQPQAPAAPTWAPPAAQPPAAPPAAPTWAQPPGQPQPGGQPPVPPWAQQPGQPGR